MVSRALTVLSIFVLAAAGVPAVRGVAAGGHDPARQKAGAAGRGRATGRAGQVSDVSGLARALRGRGLKVESAGKVSQPFFSPEGSALTVNGENVQVFRYPSARAAEAEAKKVNADGTGAGTSMAMWVGPPHFFRKGRLIVLFVGADEGVLRALTTVLGRQFAGK